MNKILAIFPDFNFDHSNIKVGGGEISNKLLLKKLSENNLVYILCAVGDGDWGGQKDGIISYTVSSLFNSKYIPKKITNNLAKLFFRFFILLIIFKVKANYIFFATYAVGFVGLCKFFLSNVKTISLVRAFENIESGNIFKRFIRWFIYGDYSIKSLNKNDFIITNSLYMIEFYTGMGVTSPIQVAYPGVDLEQVELKKVSAIKKIGMVSDAKKKGADIFVKLSQKFPKIEFHVIGAKVDETEIHNNLILHPWHDQPDQIIREMDLFLVPSEWNEPFGRVAVEGIRCGVRVLVSDNGGLPEVVNFNRKLIIEDNLLSNWITAIKILIKNPELYDDIYIELQNHAKLYFSDHQNDCVNNLIITSKVVF